MGLLAIFWRSLSAIFYGVARVFTTIGGLFIDIGMWALGVAQRVRLRAAR